MLCYDEYYETDYETSYSEDLRVENEILSKKIQENMEKQRVDEKRLHVFNAMFREQIQDIFHLKGLKFLEFGHKKVKFMFTPSEVVKHISKKKVFICSLKYMEKYGNWVIKRDNLPVYLKARKIYPLFYNNRDFAVDDFNIGTVLEEIYKFLKVFSEEEENLRLQEFKRYKSGQEVYLDSDDEEIFFNDEERAEFIAKRNAILKRMIPPLYRKEKIFPTMRRVRKRRRKFFE